MRQPVSLWILLTIVRTSSCSGREMMHSPAWWMERRATLATPLVNCQIVPGKDWILNLPIFDVSNDTAAFTGIVYLHFLHVYHFLLAYSSHRIRLREYDECCVIEHACNNSSSFDQPVCMSNFVQLTELGASHQTSGNKDFDDCWYGYDRPKGCIVRGIAVFQASPQSFNRFHSSYRCCILMLSCGGSVGRGVVEARKFATFAKIHIILYVQISSRPDPVG